MRTPNAIQAVSDEQIAKYITDALSYKLEQSAGHPITESFGVAITRSQLVLVEEKVSKAGWNIRSEANLNHQHPPGPLRTYTFHVSKR